MDLSEVRSTSRVSVMLVQAMLGKQSDLYGLLNRVWQTKNSPVHFQGHKDGQIIPGGVPAHLF